MFASEYGYTYDEILDLTFKQIYALIEYIDVRQHNQYAADAALHGKKVPFKDIKINIEKKTVEMSKENELLINKTIKEAVKRTMAEKARQRGK